MSFPKMETSPTLENIVFENQQEGDEMVDHHSYAKAAYRFRSLIQSKHQEKVKMNENATLTPQDVLDLVHSAEILSPWRPWFSKHVSAGDKQESEESRKQSRILEKVILTGVKLKER